MKGKPPEIREEWISRYAGEIRVRARQWREILGLSREEFERLSEIPQAVIAGYESAGDKIGLENIRKLIKTGVSPKWLLAGEGPIALDGARKEPIADKRHQLKRIEEGVDLSRIETPEHYGDQSLYAVAGRLKWWRELIGFSIEAFSDETGIPVETLRKYEDWFYPMSEEAFRLIREAHMPDYYILAGDRFPTESEKRLLPSLVVQGDSSNWIRISPRRVAIWEGHLVLWGIRKSDAWGAVKCAEQSDADACEEMEIPDTEEPDDFFPGFGIIAGLLFIGFWAYIIGRAVIEAVFL